MSRASRPATDLASMKTPLIAITVSSDGSTGDTSSEISVTSKTDPDVSNQSQTTGSSTPPQTGSSDGLDAQKPKAKKDKAGAGDTAWPTSSDDTDSQSDNDLNKDYRLSAYGHHSRPLKERIAKARRRLVQSNLYNQLVEDRLRAVEKDINQLLNRDPEDFTTPSQTPTHEPTIQRLAWADFKVSPFVREGVKSWTHVPEVDSTPRSILEVLVEDPQVGVRRQVQAPDNGTTLALTGPGGDNTSGGRIGSEIASVDSKFTSAIPERLRIRSPVLLKTLDQISGTAVASGPHKHKSVFLRPFKLLVTNEDKIRERLEKLETELATKRSTQSIEGQGTEIASPSLKASHSTNGHPSRRASPEVGPSGINTETETHKALEHIRLLVNFMDNDLAPVFRLRRELNEGILRVISFPDLWYLFSHGQEVRTPGSKRLQLYRVLKFTGGREVLKTSGPPPANHASVKLKGDGYSSGAFIIECVYFDFDGTQYGPVNKTFQIRKYEGEKDITSLPVFPLACDPNKESIRQALLDRGKRFTKLSNPSKPAHMQYSGLTVDKQQEQVDSQVIIDFQVAFIAKGENKPEIGISNLVDHDVRETTEDEAKLGSCNEGCCGNDFLYRDYQIDKIEGEIFMSKRKQDFDPVENAGDLNEEQKVLLPPRVYGFVLRSRRWAAFDIDLVAEVQYPEEAGWGDLVIPDSTKSAVLALVDSRARGLSQNTNPSHPHSSVDLVRGKGNGLIILLHGRPGVGKTSTAECVAVHTKRPLFPITCGDIGDNAEKVEENLEKTFQLAHKWGCVLLLDEAESRIHLSLHYPKLDRKTTERIWSNNLKRVKKDLERSDKLFLYDEEGIKKYGKVLYKELKRRNTEPWNGRQIRNAFQTAIALADYDGNANGQTPVLKQSHFETVAEAAKRFDDYILSVYSGKSDACLAKYERLRCDDWEDRQGIQRMPLEEPFTDRGSRYRGGRRAMTVEERSDDFGSATESLSESSEEDSEEEGSAPHREPAKSSKKGKSKSKSKSKPKPSDDEGSSDDTDESSPAAKKTKKKSTTTEKKRSRSSRK
ncbi:hypothetical protein GP486_001572 [Trichoglossum hirsutum]|uniref:AAA+ ATPase domain-containing protein n=1 Tax=Trichoglossum hirsutum TaxID=265104 RepID=A0A9P8RSH6_9PEZI|nr:hypothetical protein GP486_001572 [Trichoglossum hirsutum]